ncbi:MAG: hypothetical protein K5912_01280 [Alphaproteobacteria bacterium]|nr:hypothetical protein [Alphaproteobacteria bacterium]
MSKSWDSNILKKLKSLMGKGLSTAEIGKRLGISKNAVVGKLHRLGWNVKAAASEKPAVPAKKTTKAAADKKTTTKASVAKKTTVKKNVAKAAPAKKTQPKEKTPTPKKTIVSGVKKSTNIHQRIVQHALEMMDLKPGQCRWPIGDPDSEDFHFCGKQVFVGKPYCYEHCKQAYQFNAPKKKN